MWQCPRLFDSDFHVVLVWCSGIIPVELDISSGVTNYQLVYGYMSLSRIWSKNLKQYQLRLHRWCVLTAFGTLRISKWPRVVMSSCTLVESSNCLTACLNCCHVLIDMTSRNGGLLPDPQRVLECRLVEFDHSCSDLCPLKQFRAINVSLGFLNRIAFSIENNFLHWTYSLYALPWISLWDLKEYVRNNWVIPVSRWR